MNNKLNSYELLSFIKDKFNKLNIKDKFILVIRFKNYFVQNYDLSESYYQYFITMSNIEKNIYSEKDIDLIIDKIMIKFNKDAINFNSNIDYMFYYFFNFYSFYQKANKDASSIEINIYYFILFIFLICNEMSSKDFEHMQNKFITLVEEINLNNVCVTDSIGNLRTIKSIGCYFNIYIYEKGKDTNHIDNKDVFYSIKESKVSQQELINFLSSENFKSIDFNKYDLVIRKVKVIEP